MHDVTIRLLCGPAIGDVLEDLAALRIEVFREWPYLYAGTLDYERWYLGEFAKAAQALVVAAVDDDRVVGASTAAPLAHEHAPIRAPFEARGDDVGSIFYLAESVLLPAYRGRGVGHAFFDEREAEARRLGYAEAVFCAVIRPADHPLKPADYRPLDPFWRRRGYAPLEGVVCYFPWQDVGEAEETEKPLQFWGRRLDS